MGKADESRAGVDLTNLDQPIFDGAEATKRELVDYLDAVHKPFIKVLEDRPLSVIRVRPGQPGFMQKNLPKYAPDWIQTVSMWAEASHRDVAYALCNDRRTLLWFGNQRAVEFHVALVRADRWDSQTHLIMDLDPPPGAAFATAVHAAQLVHQVLTDAGLDGAVKTSGAKGLHVFVPLKQPTDMSDVAAATRAIAARAERLDPKATTTAFIKEDRGDRVFLDSTRAGGATVAAAYSPRARPGLPVSFPVAWNALDSVSPSDFTIRTAAGLISDDDPWHTLMPARQSLPKDLVAEGHEIPIARVRAMHEGKRRARAKREA